MRSDKGQSKGVARQNTIELKGPRMVKSVSGKTRINEKKIISVSGKTRANEKKSEKKREKEKEKPGRENRGQGRGWKSRQPSGILAL